MNQILVGKFKLWWINPNHFGSVLRKWHMTSDLHVYFWILEICNWIWGVDLIFTFTLILILTGIKNFNSEHSELCSFLLLKVSRSQEEEASVWKAKLIRDTAEQFAGQAIARTWCWIYTVIITNPANMKYLWNICQIKRLLKIILK